jgi:hypothetical protein
VICKYHRPFLNGGLSKGELREKWYESKDLAPKRRGETPKMVRE